MDFKFCLLAPCSELPSLAMQKFRDDVIAHAHSVRNRQFSVTINRTDQEGEARRPFWQKFDISKSNPSALSADK